MWQRRFVKPAPEAVEVVPLSQSETGLVAEPDVKAAAAAVPEVAAMAEAPVLEVTEAAAVAVPEAALMPAVAEA